MSDLLLLKDCIAEYRKANKNLDDKLKAIETVRQQDRQVEKDKQSRQG